MTQLTDHAKSILRAIADGKQIQSKIDADGNAYDISTENALKLTANGYGDELRIAPETRSINGRLFAAPYGDARGRFFDAQQRDKLGQFMWAKDQDRNAAYNAIIDALEGRTK